jgi:hypothetical protein
VIPRWSYRGVSPDGKSFTVKMADGRIRTSKVTGKTTYDGADTTPYTAKARDQAVVYSTVEPMKEVVHPFKKL